MKAGFFILTVFILTKIPQDVRGKLAFENPNKVKYASYLLRKPLPSPTPTSPSSNMRKGTQISLSARLVITRM
jgi:hypothetical protein